MTRRTLLGSLLTLPVLALGCWSLRPPRPHAAGESVLRPVAASRRPDPLLRVTPLVGQVGQVATAQVTGLSDPANPEWRWARLVVESPDGSTPIDSLWGVPNRPQTRTWTLRGEGLTIVSLVLYTHDTRTVAWRTEYLLDTHSPDALP